MDTMPSRSAWATTDPLLTEYYDTEWGMPVRDEAGVFERLSLEAFQSGLSWLTVLRKREAFREAFAGFDPDAVAAFDERDVERLLGNNGIIRNRMKIDATIANARALLALHAQGQQLADVFEAHRPATRDVRPNSFAEVPASTAESVALAKHLKRLGFRFVGPTTAYAAMQALGYVDDHLAGCLVVQ